MIRSTQAKVFFALLASSLAPACGSDSSNASSGAAQVETCTQLCSLAPVDDHTADCVTQFVGSKGYNIGDPRCSNANTESGCSDCYGAIGVSDSDCAATHDKCF